MENELRRDYFTERRVIISTGRGRRPTDYKLPLASAEDTSPGCLFCPGNEAATPPEIMRVEEAGKWAIRVFPNKFPAATKEPWSESESLIPSYGSHEVVVESPDHAGTLAEMSADRLARVLDVYSKRADAMLSDMRVGYALVFKNHGRVAGASLAHTHTQIISTPIVPQVVAEEVEGARKYRARKGSCPLCDAQETESRGPRAVFNDGKAAAFAPYASRSPFEAWVMPVRHVRALNELSVDELLSLAEAMRVILKGLKYRLNDPPYNMFMHMSPRGEDMHLHFEILPRISILAGFEFGSGIVINTLAPEKAAEFYGQK